MGIIQKQALRSTLVNFVGAIFGAVSRLTMPVVLAEYQIGFLALLDAVSGIFVTIFSLGFEQILARLFPKFRDEQSGHNGFLMLGIYFAFFGIVLSSIAYFLAKDLFMPNDDGTGQLGNFAIFIFPLLTFRILFRNMDGYAGMLMNTVLGSVLDGLVSKLLLFLGLMGFALSFLNFDYLIIIFVISLCLPGFVMTIYAFLKTEKIVQPSTDFRQPALRKEILQYVGFGVLMSASSSIIFYVDSLMVNNLISVEALGVYSTFFFAARLMAIPARSLSRISAVIIAESWKVNDLENIKEVYRKSCLNQLLIGAFLFGIGWACIEPALSFLPPDKVEVYSNDRYVFFFLGLALLVELATGLNSALIGTSDKYKYNTYFNLILAVCVVVLNYVLILVYNTVGAAIATMLAMVIVNFMRWLFVFRAYKMQPFDRYFIRALIFSIVFISAASFIDYQADPMVKILVNGSVFTLSFVLVLLVLKISPDVNDMLNKYLKRN